MPPQSRSASGKESKTTCDVENIYRDWKGDHQVRRVLIECDRTFRSHKQASDPVKFCIKDAVFNKPVLLPLLHCVAQHPSHVLPGVKPLAREILGANISGSSFFGKNK